jgi:hypothetical protein
MKLRPLFLWFTGLLTAVVLLVGALLLTFWVWTDSDTSLATALQQASRYLPAGQVLVAEDVRGTLRKGGHIGLRWPCWTAACNWTRCTWPNSALMTKAPPARPRRWTTCCCRFRWT